MARVETERSSAGFVIIFWKLRQTVCSLRRASGIIHERSMTSVPAVRLIMAETDCGGAKDRLLLARSAVLHKGAFRYDIRKIFVIF